MSLFTNVLTKILTKAAEAIFLTAGTVIGITAAVADRAIELMADEYRKYQGTSQAIASKERSKRLTLEIKEINEGILELEQKQQRDGFLKEDDRHALHNLNEGRDNIRKLILNDRELIVAENIYLGKGEYGSINITSTNSHILQFHVGQTVFGKKCHKCSKPMILQFRRGQYSIGMNDFFWSCVGWYEDHNHNVTESFKATDMDLFTRVDRPEFEVTAPVLGSLIQMPGPAKSVSKRLSEAKNTATDVYFCPIHQEGMILREKRIPEGLLDQYFFSCPRNECEQLVKIKSPAQLASALEAFYGRGIL